MERRDYQLARNEFDRAIDAGVLDGAIHLGWLCEQGLGGPQDIERATRLYEVGRSQDRRLGSYHLGSLLMRSGQTEKARQLLEESADLGQPSAAYWAYVMNSDAMHEERARHFLEKAAHLGHAFAQRDLARAAMREAPSLGRWATAMLAYWAAKVRGISIAVRNSHDPRVR